MNGAEEGGGALGLAHLEGTDLHGAYLEEGWLSDTDLHLTDLGDAHLKGTHATQKTIWPAGFDLSAAGVKM